MHLLAGSKASNQVTSARPRFSAWLLPPFGSGLNVPTPASLTEESKGSPLESMGPRLNDGLVDALAWQRWRHPSSEVDGS